MLIQEWLVQRHETTDRAVIVSGAKVVEAGFGVAFFSCEVDGALVATHTGKRVAEWETGARFEGIRIGVTVAKADRAEPIRVVEPRVAVNIRHKVATASVYFRSALNAAVVYFQNPMTSEIVDVVAVTGAVTRIVDHAGAVNALSICVVGVGGYRRPATGDLDDAILGVVRVFSSSLELSHGASLIRSTNPISHFGGPHKASIGPDTTLRSPMCQVPRLLAVSKGSSRQRDPSPKNQCASNDLL
jgi:hypothetical protein